MTSRRQWIDAEFAKNGKFVPVKPFTATRRKIVRTEAEVAYRKRIAANKILARKKTHR